MNSSFARRHWHFTCLAVTTILALASSSRAQQIPNQSAMGAAPGTVQDQLYVGTVGAQAEREQEADYNAFLKEQDPAKKIALGNSFLQKHPKSRFAERVDVGLMMTYHKQQDWKNAYRYADYALALRPDDADVLATIGWTIPHVYNPSDPDADQELNKAEKYATQAIEVLAKLPKPPDLTEKQFESSKAIRIFQAHSALGLVYFRRKDYDHSAKELELATKGNASPDGIDLFILGVDLQSLHRYSEAAEAFRGCSQIAGTAQDRCKQAATAAQAQADQSNPK